MRYNSNINNVKSKEWGLNIQQAYLFSWFYELPSWAEKVIIGEETYYFASKNKAVEELPLLTDKRDTMYRYYKQIEKIGLITIKKVDGKDYIALTSKGKQWNEWKSDNSEINPNTLGNKSETYSEINPTYNTTINNNIINNNIPQTVFSDQVNSTYDRLEKLFNGIYHPNNQKTADKRLKTTEKWKDCIDKLNRIDGHSFETIEKVITWVKKDDFWKDKFLTLVKARQIKDDIMRFDYWKDKMDREKPQRKEIKKPRIVF